MSAVFSVVMLSRGRADYTSRSLDALSASLPESASEDPLRRPEAARERRRQGDRSRQLDGESCRCRSTQPSGVCSQPESGWGVRTHSDDTEVILVDDGSTDSSVQQAFDRFKRANPRVPVKVIRFKDSVGAVNARNQAVQSAEGEFIALLDNDCIARSKNWLSGLRAAFHRHPDAGVIGVRLVYPLRHNAETPVIQCAGCVVTLSGRVGFRGRGDPADNLHFAAEEEVQAVISACWLTTRSLWNEIGGMDTTFSPCQFEDIDYCYRARELGRKIIYAPSVEMYHFENVTSGGIAGVNYGALTARNSLIFRKKWAASLEKEGAPPPSAVTWRTDIPTIRLEDNPALELITGADDMI